MSSLPVVLTIGASDASGAAGIQADQLAIASMGCHPASVITRIGSSESVEEDTFLPIDPEWLEAQAQGVLNNMAVAAFKVGTLGSIDQVQPIAAIVADYDAVPVVLDPGLQDAADDDAADLALAWRPVRSDTVPHPGSGGRWTGVGTTLSAALAGLLAQGVDLPEAAHEAIQYAAVALLNAFRPASG